MKKLILVALSLSSVSSVAEEWRGALSEHPTWGACRIDADCTIANGSVLGPAPVNQKSQKTFEDWARNMSAQGAAPDPGGKRLKAQIKLLERIKAGEVKAVCKSNRCDLSE